MDDIPLGTLFAALFVLLLVSGFFSISETSMMALNRYRLRHLVQHKHRGATIASELLSSTDRFLGVVLLGNNLINAASALLVGRHVYGWRGRVAVRWTLAGFLTLVLAYIGSKFVLEVVLGR